MKIEQLEKFAHVKDESIEVGDTIIGKFYQTDAASNIMVVQIVQENPNSEAYKDGYKYQILNLRTHCLWNKPFFTLDGALQEIKERAKIKKILKSDEVEIIPNYFD